MDLIFGNGSFTEGQIRCEGRIILAEHRLFLRGPEGDLTQSFIPLEKINRIKRSPQGIEISFRITMTIEYKALLTGERKNLDELLKELVSRRKFKKLFLRREWVEENS